MKTKSCKAKARRLQNTVADMLRTTFDASSSDIKPAIMGESGVDIHLSDNIKSVFPFSIECKNTERLDLWGALEQSESNCIEGTKPIVIFKRNNSDIYCVLKLNDFMGVFNASRS